MREVLQQFLEDLRRGENIDLYVVSVAAVVLAVLNLVGVDSGRWATSVSLGALGVLAFAMLGNRHRIDSVVRESSSAGNPPLRMRTELGSLQESAKSARNVLIVAFSGAEVLRQTDFFADRLFQGATVRIAIADPENDALVEAMSPLTGIPREGFIADVQVAMGLIQVIRKQTSNTGRLQVRMFDYAPTLSLVMVDGDRPTGHIVVELRPYQVSSSSRPHLFLTARDNRVWYDYFRDVGESIWRDAKPVLESSLANQ